MACTGFFAKRGRFFSLSSLLLSALFLLFSSSPLYARVSYTLAVYPMEDLKSLYTAFTCLADFVTSKTGWEMRVLFTRNYEEMQERLGDGSLDFAFITSAAYIRFAPQVSYVATYAQWNEEYRKIMPYYYSFIISLKDGPVKTLRDLKNQNFGFADRESTSGHRVPRLILCSAGMEPEKYFKKVFYLGRHDRVIASLLAGSIEGGAVSGITLKRAVSQYGEIFRILAVSGPIPLSAVVASPKIEQEHVEILRKVLLSLSPDFAPVRIVREIFGWPAIGFVYLGAEAYDIRNVLHSASDVSFSGDAERK